jgi:hypothetical protein
LSQHQLLSQLGELYGTHLRTAGKVKSANQVKSIFKVHILGAWPEVATLPANQVTAHQVAAMLCKVAEAGKERTSGYVRQSCMPPMRWQSRRPSLPMSPATSSPSRSRPTPSRPSPRCRCEPVTAHCTMRNSSIQTPEWKALYSWYHTTYQGLLARQP